MMRSDRVLILPCRIGDRVFCVRNYRGTKIPKDGIVSNMHFSKDMELIIEVKYVGQGVWGKKIFGTYEDATKAVNGVVAAACAAGGARMKNGYQPKTKNPNPDYRPPIGRSNVRPADGYHVSDKCLAILSETLRKAFENVFSSVYGEEYEEDEGGEADGDA